MAQQFDEVEIGCGHRGEVIVTDEQVEQPHLLGLSVYDPSKLGAYAYLEMTRDETVRLRDELTRRIGDSNV